MILQNKHDTWTFGLLYVFADCCNPDVISPISCSSYNWHCYKYSSTPKRPIVFIFIKLLRGADSCVVVCLCGLRQPTRMHGHLCFRCDYRICLYAVGLGKKVGYVAYQALLVVHFCIEFTRVVHGRRVLLYCCIGGVKI